MAKVKPLSKASIRKPNPDDSLPQIDAELEQKKAAGQTEDQKANTAYHKGAFQTHDPVTGLKRDKPLS